MHSTGVFHALYGCYLNVRTLHNKNFLYRNQGCGVGGKSDSNSDLSKIFESHSLTSTEWNLTVKINENRGAQQEISVSTKVSKEITISTGIPNLGVWCNKWFNWTCEVGVGQKNPTPSVVRNPIPNPPRNIRFRLRNPAVACVAITVQTKLWAALVGHHNSRNGAIRRLGKFSTIWL